MRVLSLLPSVLAVAFLTTPVFGCSCVPPPPGVKTAGEVAQWYANRSDAIFEGTVERIELKWALMEAKNGELVPADLDQEQPSLLVTFDASVFYKGTKQRNTELTTGVGGGDCGFDFRIGKKYLVYAFADALGHLSAGICSGTGLSEESQSALSYLRGEQTIPERTEQNADPRTTQLCGRIAGTASQLDDSRIFLFRVGSRSPMPSDEGEVEQNGSFCIGGVRPGSYYLEFLSLVDDSPMSLALFPGVANSSQAKPIEIGRSRVWSALTLHIPPEPTFSVSGDVFLPKNSAMPAQSKVFLMNADPLSFLVAYSEDVEPNGYFEFPHVLPGKYWAFVGVDSNSAPNWLTKEAEVQVNEAIRGLSLELVQK